MAANAGTKGRPELTSRYCVGRRSSPCRSSSNTISGIAELDGSKRYTLHFAPGHLPQVEGFWSITLYDSTYNLQPSQSIAIGDRTPGLKRRWRTNYKILEQRYAVPPVILVG